MSRPAPTIIQTVRRRMPCPTPNASIDLIPRPTIEQLQRSQRARTAQRRGDNTEILVGLRLKQMGFLCLERVVTPKRFNKKTGKVTYTRKVSGDWIGVGAGGRSLRVEVKKRGGRNLCYSDLEPHQWLSLRDHHAAGGLSLIAYLAGLNLHFLPIERVNLRPGESLTPAGAAQLHMVPS